ncbi:mechanosensitive ion channel family protein [Roseofilum casamattae]|uniref:Mechanosensitive ion channel family protein n=1 Tax=Roseofilum casamattae BLCC-M143 TaxID=3022442 RepID=A0ABT7BYE0_9CYAN|nr:mechanosensitive ion channel family protein [Roseofilum casamattae]MDJ1184217.1 mechanosensitive ion channel family protein [Roseofilum casamattae BLCC-M143]
MRNLKWYKGIQCYGLAIVTLLLAILLQAPGMGGIAIPKPLKPPDTSSPQATLRSFINDVNSAHEELMEAYTHYLEEPGLLASQSVLAHARVARQFFDRASRCLDTREAPERLQKNVATEGTLLLKEILDRIELPYYSEIPDREYIENASSKDRDDLLIRWQIPDTEIEIVEITEGKHIGEFLFSQDTVSRLSEFYEKVNHLPYKPGSTVGFYQFYSSTPGRLLPPKWFQWLPEYSRTVYWDQTLWQWLSLLIVIIITFLGVFFIFLINSKKIKGLSSLNRSLGILPAPLLSIFLFDTSSHFLSEQINITGSILLISITLFEFFFWNMVAFLTFCLINAIAEAVIHHNTTNKRKVDTNLIRVFVRLISFGLGGLILLYGVQQLGINLLPLIAGLGVGGLAIALGAQSTLENMIAGLALFFDSPVTVGDLCVFGEQEGIVQSIGLRSIRLRGVDGTWISMPNSAFCQLELINKSRCDKILFKHKIHLSYETTSEQLQFILIKFRGMLMEHPMVLELPFYVRCVEYSDFAIDIEFFAYIGTANQQKFLFIQEELLLKIKDIVEEVGTTFATSV